MNGVNWSCSAKDDGASMNRPMNAIKSIVAAFVTAFAAAWASGAMAQPAADAGILNQMQGAVQWVEAGKAPIAALPFMKVREGDVLRVPNGGSARIVYFANGRQETWKGPAEVRVEAAQGVSSQAKAEVTQLPVDVSQKLVRTSLLATIVREARPGSVAVRSAIASAEIRAARERYDEMRKVAAPDDITPEMYLFTTLEAHRRHDDMKQLLQVMESRHPGDPLVKELAAWLDKEAR